jgi:hypothetical protein
MDGRRGWQAAILLCLAAALFLLPYGSAVNTRDAQVDACEASKVDRGLQADSWEAAYTVRAATANDPDSTPAQRKEAEKAADVYRETFERLRARSDSRYVCAEVFPPPSPLPF